MKYEEIQNKEILLKEYDYRNKLMERNDALLVKIIFTLITAMATGTLEYLQNTATFEKLNSFIPNSYLLTISYASLALMILLSITSIFVERTNKKMKMKIDARITQLKSNGTDCVNRQRPTQNPERSHFGFDVNFYGDSRSI